MSVKEIVQPDLPTICAMVVDDALSRMNKVSVGRIESFDPLTQTASVTLMIKKVLKDNDDGSTTIVDRPLLPHCLVMGSYGGDSYITFPISVGDECIVLFNDRELDNWYITGEPQAPDTNRKHHIADGIVFVGVRSSKNVIENYSQNSIQLKYLQSQIDILQNKVEVLTTMVEINATKTVCNSDVEINGEVEINGNVLINGNALANTYASNDGSMSIQGGRLTVTNATIASIDFATHKHSNPEGGNTGVPH
jgi:hypothetical protein